MARLTDMLESRVYSPEVVVSPVWADVIALCFVAALREIPEQVIDALGTNGKVNADDFNLLRPRLEEQDKSYYARMLLIAIGLDRAQFREGADLVYEMTRLQAGLMAKKIVLSDWNWSEIEL